MMNSLRCVVIKLFINKVIFHM